MPDYGEMIARIESAEKEVKKGIESLYPIKKLTQLEAYVLGHLRAAQAVLEKARESAQQTKATKEKPTPATKQEDE